MVEARIAGRKLGMMERRWKQIEGLFESAMQRDPSERDSYLEEACGGDEELRRELKALLAGEDRTSFLKQGAATAGLRAVELRASLQPGQRLGPYVIESHLASGGMGMVYRAQDPRLGRRVAIKILRLAVAGDKVRSLLMREAQSIAKMQHPNICAVFDMGEQEGLDYLVMEYLEGETLADRLKRGPLPLTQALEYATQIGAALDQAHKRDIVHRDLKPGNVMITKTGAKLLDFGLAALRRPSGDLGFDRTEFGMTATGPVGGTLPYMAPEQVRGEATDNRTDIFAYGLLLYEMLTGHRAFEQREPEALAREICNSPLPDMPAVPTLLQRVIRVCVAKEPDERWQSAGDLKREIAWIASSPEGAVRPSRWRWPAAAAVLALALAGAGWAGYSMRAPATKKPVQFAIAPPPGTSFRPNLDLALSPNGEQLVFAAVTADGKSMLWIRPLDALNARVLPGTEGGYSPFWSPDNRQLAFFAGGKMKKLDPLGSAVQTICDAPGGRGGSWGRDGTILFNPKFFSEVYRVNASGGTPVRITTLDSSLEELMHAFPSFLPDGNHFLFTAIGNRHVGKVYV
ncbi:MAG: serine/threonine-protein kinase, partial [Acidobacteriota bacterium]|nr:serine/threonine-protein kinase [Acidobacteriota bacterium]